MKELAVSRGTMIFYREVIVAPFLRDCKGRSYCRDRLTGQTERKMIEFIVILFKLISSLVEPEVTRRIIQLSITTG